MSAATVHLDLQRSAPEPVVSLRTNFIWTFVGNSLHAACSWSILILIAKLRGPEMVGRYALGVAIVLPLVSATSCLRSIVATDARQEYAFLDYLRLRLNLTLLMMLTLAGFCWISGYDASTTAVILAVGAAQAVDSISEIYYGRLQQQERMARIAKSMIIRGVAALTGFAVAMFCEAPLPVAICVITVVRGTVLFFYDRKGQEQPADVNEVPRPGRHSLFRIVWLASPLAIVVMLNALNVTVPRFFVERYLGVRVLGIFSALAWLITVGATVVGAMGQVVVPRLAKLYIMADSAGFRRLVIRFLAICLALGCAGVGLAAVGGPALLRLLYKPEYAEHNSEFVALMGVGALIYIAQVPMYAITAARRFATLVPVLVCTTVISAALCRILIPHYGIPGAAAAMAAAALSYFAGGFAVFLFLTASSKYPPRRQEAEEA